MTEPIINPQNNKQGYVYVLSNPSCPEYIKVGMSKISGQQRARDLFTTGVVQKFILEFEILSPDCRSLENDFHEMFSDIRVEGREFFCLPVTCAIERLLELYLLQIGSGYTIKWA